MPLAMVVRNGMADWLADQIGKITLHSANPGLTGANQIGEAATTTGSDWTESSGRAQNNTKISFPAAVSDLGTATHFTLRMSDDTVLASEELDDPRLIAQGAVASFDIGELGVTVPQATSNPDV